MSFWKSNIGILHLVLWSFIQSCQPLPPPPPPIFFGEISIFLVRWRATCQLWQAKFFVFNIKSLHTWICCPFPLIIITSTVKGFLLNELLCWNLLQSVCIYIYIYIIIHVLYIYVQTIYWQDFTLDFHEIRWTFGRAWDWANFRESHEKFVRFGNSVYRIYTVTITGRIYIACSGMLCKS